MQEMVMQASSITKPIGTGGFLHPETIVEDLDIKEGMKIADFGTGAGYFTILLAQKAGPTGRVYALDILESALDNVRSKAGVSGVDNIETIRTNLEILGSTGLADNSQDLVFLANILFQSKKDGDIIKEGQRILKAGGKLVIIDWKKGTGGFGPPDDLRLSHDEMRKIAEKTGLVFERSFEAGQFHFGLTLKK